MTVTSGRSGTGLLARLLSLYPDTTALHEPEPRLNYQLRRVIADPCSAFDYIVNVKLSAIAATATLRYVETSHLYCKGFIEPLLLLGIRPAFCILQRNPRDVALSLYAMNVIPGRTFDGLLVLLKPDDRNVMPLVGWESVSDYALCYWYAMEIERRQRKYAELFKRMGITHVTCQLRDLLTYSRFIEISSGLGFDEALERAGDLRLAYDQIVAVDQNPRNKAMPETKDRFIEGNIDADERLVEELISLYEPDLATHVRSAYAR